MKPRARVPRRPNPNLPGLEMARNYIRKQADAYRAREQDLWKRRHHGAAWMAWGQGCAMESLADTFTLWLIEMRKPVPSKGRWEYIGYVDFFNLPKSARTRVVRCAASGHLVRQVWRPSRRASRKGRAK